MASVVLAAEPPTELTCEYLTTPRGVDVARPRLAWLPPSSGRISAYQVLVASSPEVLATDAGDLWDSGRVESERSTLVEYAGRPLQSGDQCYWKVRTWGGAGAASPWSTPALWTMGPMRPADWTAKWVGPPESHRIETTDQNSSPVWDPWVRKSFELPWRPDVAELHVASIGYHELRVNGRRASPRVLAPAVANHRVRARYVTYDLAPLLRRGKNAITLWLGASWSIYPHYRTPTSPGLPVVLAQGDFRSGDERLRIATDESWLTRPSPNRLLGKWEFRHFGGEHYDASRELAGWDQAGLDESGWDPVKVYEPGVAVSAELVEPNLVTERFDAAGVTPIAAGEHRVDMGRNFAGLLEVDIVAEPGTVVTIDSSEKPDEAQMYSLHSEYVVGESGRGTFRSRFNYHSGRYLTIKGLTRRPLASDIRGLHVRTGYRRAGRFACSDQRLNVIYDTTLWTFENLSLGGYLVDCPQRERMGYGGDAHATLLTSLVSYKMGAFYTKWAQDWRDCQYDDGYLPNTAPTYWGGGGPGWGGYCITMPWEFYRWHGDRRLLAEQRPTIERWLAFMDSTSVDDLLTPWHGRDTNPQDRWAFLGDWLWPGMERGTNSHMEKTLFFNNCYWVYNLQTAAKIMRALGDQASAADYDARADEVRAAIHARFYQPDHHSYVNGQQAYLAMALLAGVPPEDQRALVWRRLEEEILVDQGGRIDAGITGGAILFKTLMEAGRNDLIYPMVARDDYPSWGHMLSQGATTIWESWDERGHSGGSKLHSSYLYVGAWPLYGLVGIRPGEEPGFKQFTVCPASEALQRLDWFSGEYSSPQGPIGVDAERSPRGYELTISVPAGTRCRFVTPAGWASSTGSGEFALPPGVHSVDLAAESK